MEYIKKNELIKDKVYYVEDPNHWMIGLVTLPNNGDNNGLALRGRATIITKRKRFSKDTDWCYKDLNRTYRLATPNEKHWLNCCITANKFITFEEAMKTLIPEIEPLPQFKVIESIETITKVENNEGNQFFIGDVVISSNGTVQTIESFNYNKAKTNIIAFTNKQSILGNGIGIDKIEHYIEPKVEVEETLLEKAKRLYPVGTKFIARNTSKECIITTGIFQQNSMDYEFINEIDNTGNDIQTSYIFHCIYSKDKWAKIIE